MPSDYPNDAPRKIAVIGAGISGMSAAYHLAAHNRVTLFETSRQLGGHARTIIAGKRGDQPVDTGFIVFNKVNYPNLTRLFEELDVPIVESDMSFGASIQGGELEYGLADFNTIFAQRRNLTRPRFLKMLRDIVRFNTRAASVSDDPGLSINDFLKQLGTGDWFRDHYLLPFTGAIWSTPVTRMQKFPAQALIRFMENHALLSYDGSHQWYTVEGGSIEYVGRLEAALRAKKVEIRTSCPIKSVSRGEKVSITPVSGSAETFDEVVFATHSDQALALLADARDEEQSTLSAIQYQPNEAVLHADTSLMPKRRKVWSSWVYCEAKGPRPERIDLTYWMNSLQPIPENDPLFVTLNSNRPIREELIHDTHTFHHPVYTIEALAAQEQIRAMNGRDNTWFCGAWMRNGFHEDGYASAIEVVNALDALNTARQAA